MQFGWSGGIKNTTRIWAASQISDAQGLDPAFTRKKSSPPSISHPEPRGYRRSGPSGLYTSPVVSPIVGSTHNSFAARS